MKIYEPSITLSDRDSLTFDGASSADAAVDNDKNTLVNSSQANPDLTIDFGAGETRTASSLWLRSRGYTTVEVLRGATSVGSYPIPVDGYLYAEFAEGSAQTWTLQFTGTGGVYEAYLCRKILDFDTDERRPLKWRMPRQAGVFIRAADASLINFQPFGFGGGQATITLEWTLLENPAVEMLFDVYQAGAARNLQFSVYPDPTNRPRHFFQARWESDFAFAYAGAKVSDGQSGSIVFIERETSNR